MTTATLADAALALADRAILETVDRLLAAERRLQDAQSRVDPSFRDDRLTNAIYQAGREREMAFERMQTLLFRRATDLVCDELSADS